MIFCEPFGSEGLDDSRLNAAVSVKVCVVEIKNPAPLATTLVGTLGKYLFRDRFQQAGFAHATLADDV